jgi:hypothetical protein
VKLIALAILILAIVIGVVGWHATNKYEPPVDNSPAVGYRP